MSEPEVNEDLVVPVAEPDTGAHYDPPGEPEAAAEPAVEAVEFRPVVAGANPTHGIQEVIDWILDKIGR